MQDRNNEDRAKHTIIKMYQLYMYSHIVISDSPEMIY